MMVMESADDLVSSYSPWTSLSSLCSTYLVDASAALGARKLTTRSSEQWPVALSMSPLLQHCWIPLSHISLTLQATPQMMFSKDQIGSQMKQRWYCFHVFFKQKLDSQAKKVLTCQSICKSVAPKCQICALKMKCYKKKQELI